MWEFELTQEFSLRVKRFSKNHPKELQAALANLNRLQKSLQNGANPLNIPLGCLHKEKRGVLAVDQKGHGGNLKQTRLYVYLDQGSKTIHLITLGDKKTQPFDIKYAAEFVDSLNDSR